MIFWTRFCGIQGCRDVAGDIVELDQAFALTHAGFKIDARGVDGGAGVHGSQLSDHGVGRVDARFGLCGAGLGAAPQPFNLSPDAIAQAVLLPALGLEVGLFLFEEMAEVALHAKKAAGKNTVQLDNLA